MSDYGTATRPRGGFTYLELMVVLAILGVLAWMVEPALTLAAQRQRESKLRTALADLRGAIDAYKRAADQGRIAMKPGESAYPRTLAELVEGVPDIKAPDRRTIYFLRRIPRDPMHSDLSAPAASTWALRSYASPPEDPKEGEDVFDVTSRSAVRGTNGVPYREW